jgi:hypothetical protein
MNKLINIKLTKEQIQSIIDLIDNNNQFSDTKAEVNYWDTIAHLITRQMKS